MPRPLNAEEKKLLALAKAQQSEIHDAAVANAWNVIVEAVEKAWLGMSGAFSLHNTITELAGGGRIAVEEYAIEVSPDDPDEVIVSLMADQFYAPRAALLHELRRLLARQRGEDAAASAPAIEVEAREAEAREPAPAPEPEKIAPIVPLKIVPRPPVAATPAEDDHDDDDDDEDSGTFAEQLGKMIDSFADRVKKPEAAPAKAPDAPQRLGLLDSIRAELDKARAEQAAKHPGGEPSPAAAEAKAALDKVIDKVRNIDRDQLAVALHNVADWVKSPEGGAAAFEGMLAKLQTNLNAAFDKSAKPAGESPAESPFRGVREAMEKRIAEAKEKVEREKAEREKAERMKRADNPPPDDN